MPTSSSTANPNINIKITQFGWDDYWSKLTNGFIAGDAPDVFTDHLSKYPEFVSQQQLVPLDDTLTKDGFNVDQYQAGLADLWKGQDGKRYGLPKDFDTIAIFYNKKLVADAGVKEADLQNLHLESPRRRNVREDHRPSDGGSERKARRRAGLRQVQGQGLRPGTRRRLGRRNRTDPVEHVHRLQQLAIHRQEPVGHPLQLRPARFPADHRLVPLADREGLHAIGCSGHRPGLVGHLRRRQVRHDHQRLLEDQQLSSASKGIETGVAPTPVGPSGKRASMYNGLADSIWVGSKNKPAAAKWVEFLGSPDCQNIVGEKAVVFPAIPEATEKAEAALKAKGIDVPRRSPSR